MPTRPDPEVSVVVPTRNRPGALGRCLAAVGRQRDAPAAEVLVVDDGSTEAALVAEIAQLGGARVTRTDGLGVAAARNVGAAASTAPFVCFTDDDCEPTPEWLGVVVGRLRDGADVVMGRTESGGGVYASASQLVANAFVDDPPANAVSFAPSSNLACRRKVVAEVAFDERYHVAGEDRVWLARVKSAGYSIVYDAASVVVHSPQLDLRSFWRKHVNYGRAARDVHRASFGRRFQPPSFYARLVARAFRRGWAIGALVALAQLATAVGYASAAIRARRRR